MKKLLLSGFVFAAMTSSALAAEPLTEQQMDTITAGTVLSHPGRMDFFTMPTSPRPFAIGLRIPPEPGDHGGN